MPTFKVFHLKDGARWAFSERAYREHWPTLYDHVATVEAPVLGAVFELTNHIDRPWTDNPEVTLPPADAAKVAAARERDPYFFNSSMVLMRRSTSVGDVITTVDRNHFGSFERAWGVAGFGFEEVTTVTVAPEDWGLKETT